MDDMKEVLDAVKHLNQVWAAFSKKQTNLSSDIYSIFCNVEDAVLNLNQKIGTACKCQILRDLVV